jgi:putative membrane protein
MRRATTLLAILAVAACGPRDTHRSETGAASSAATDSAVTTDTAATNTATTPKLSDPNIVALLDEANKADSAAGALARTKATSPAVKDFAKLMMSEHHALRQEGQKLAKQLNVTPEPPANDPVKSLAESETAALTNTPKGAQFDSVYIEQEITAHKAVLDLADEAHGQAQNEQLKALIEKAKPVIQKHLDQAQKIQGELGKPTS